jgi:tRNA1Val (adenine37-N6)-methyltransferase
VTTRETPAAGVVVYQPRKGFRYAADAFWLAGFALEGGPARTALDLGTGSGIVALLLAARGLSVDAIDVRPEWQPLWQRSLAESTLAGSVRFALSDARAWPGAGYDLAVSNPPFFPSGSGPSSPDAWKAAARTESGATLADFVRAGLAAAPRLCLVLPVDREAEVLALAPARRRVHVGAKRALLELAEGAITPSATELGEDDAEVRGWYSLARFGAAG